MVHGLATYLGFGIWLWEFRGAGSRGLRRCIITFRARHQAVLTLPNHAQKKQYKGLNN